MGPEPIRVRRMLERPIGSVRWKEDTPDRSTGDVAPIASPGSGPVAKGIDHNRAGAGAQRADVRLCIACALDDLALAMRRGPRPRNCQSPRGRLCLRNARYVQPITLEEIDKRPLPVKLRDTAARLAMPYI